MKKRVQFYLFILLCWFLIQCDNPTSTDSNGRIIPETLSPPAWIIRNWSDDFIINNYTFTTDNVVFSADGTTIDFQAMNYLFASQGAEGTGYYDSTPTATNYTIEAKHDYVTAQTLIFQQTSAVTLDYSVDGIGPINLNKQ